MTGKSDITELDIKIGDRLRRIRKDRSESLNSVSEAVEFSSQVLSGYEDGARKIPLHRFHALCTHYQKNASDLLREVEQELSGSIQAPSDTASSIKEKLHEIIRSHAQLDDKIYRLGKELALHINLGLVTVFQFHWDDNSLRRIKLHNGEYLFRDFTTLSKNREKYFKEKFKDQETAEYDCTYIGNQYLTRQAWKSWPTRDRKESMDRVYIPTYYGLIANKKVGLVNQYSYERHEEMLGGNVKSTMYGVIDVLYPRYLLRVFNRSDLKNVSISLNQYSLFIELCGYISNCFREMLSMESLNELQEQSHYFENTTTSLKSRLKKLNEIIIRNELPEFYFLVRNGENGDVEYINANSNGKLSLKAITRIRDEYGKESRFEKDITPVVFLSGSPGGYLIYPMNETEVGSGETNDKLKSMTEYKGLVVIPLGNAISDSNISYEDIKNRAPELFENIEQYVKIACGVVSM